MVLCGTKKRLFYAIAVKNLLSTFIFKSVHTLYKVIKCIKSEYVSLFFTKLNIYFFLLK